MGDDEIVISSGLVITPETVTNRSFASAFRGFHPAEVRQFLKRVGDEMAASAGREVELRRALQEALARAAHPELDEATVTNVLGEHAARLMANARDTAASLTAEAREQADAMLRGAELQVARMRDEAEGLMARRVAEADAAAAAIQHSARAEADALVDAAKRQGKDMVGEARDVRERMLGDLARRRRSAQMQLEQLRAARERLLAAFDVVRRTTDEATAELEAAEPEARMAAEAVARRSEEIDATAALAAGGGAARRHQAVTEVWSPSLAPAEPERARSLVSSSVGPAVGEQRETSVPSTTLSRAPLRPQTVADAVAGRRPAPVLRTTPPAPAPPPAAEGAPGAKVEELFARIRADRSVDDLGEPSVSPAVPEEPPPAPGPVDSERALEGRDELLDNLEAGLTRALKRVLQDEQNQVLDGLRRLGADGAAAVLPELDAQTAGYRDAALPWLQQAARAGVGFVSDPASRSNGDSGSPSVGTQAQSLALEIVGPLRERLSRAVAGGAEADDPSVVAESLRATYRQWKVQHVEECARHHAVTAFSAGAFEATPEGATLQWLVDDDGHCPDCDDNALAGPTCKGETFPTGQLHPPAHRGCRCLLVAVTT